MEKNLTFVWRVIIKVKTNNTNGRIYYWINDFHGIMTSKVCLGWFWFFFFIFFYTLFI